MATSKTGSILIVDDEPSIRKSLSPWFRKDGYHVEAVGNASDALQAMQTQHFDVVLLDIRMPGMDGMELQERIHTVDPRIAVIMITAFASVDTAVRAMKQGAFDYVTKPIDPEELSLLVMRAMEQRKLETENAKLRETIDDLVAVDRIVGDSPPMRKVLELVERVADTEATVLIRGESGTGKELIARTIHSGSKRRYSPLVAVNCGGLPDSLLESELFGHEKGAFTGAQNRHKGKIEQADGGTLFLDEVGSINPKMQVDLLRVLETKQVTRVGGDHPFSVDFRVICATNDDLDRALAEGRFRQDFYYRINVFTIELPPLRDRRSDIPALVDYFLKYFSSQMDKRISGIDPAAMKVLTTCDWPGNVRELSNAIERAMVVGKPPCIRPEDLPPPSSLSKEVRLDQSLAEIEKRHIAAVLERTEGNITQAAEILQIDRVTVYNKIKKYGLRR